MDAIAALKSKVKTRVSRFIRAEVAQAVSDILPLVPQLVEFTNSPKDVMQSYRDHTKDPLGNYGVFVQLGNRLREIGVPVMESHVDIADFETWLARFPQLSRHYRRARRIWIEKCLEHYLAFRYLNIRRGDVYIDVGAQNSPFAGLLRNRGIRSYRLDVVYRKGIHGIDIGDEASNTSLPDGFASVLSAQGAFQLFEGDGDIRFLKEAGRLLNGNGRYVLLPLLLDETYMIVMSPFCRLDHLKIDTSAMKVWRDDGIDLAWSRHYSPESFKERIYLSIPEDMEGKIMFIENLPDLIKRYPGEAVYCYFLFYCEKRKQLSASADSPGVQRADHG